MILKKLFIYYIALFCLQITINTCCSAQPSISKESNIWKFGPNLGLDFNFVPPSVLIGGEIGISECSASISDTNGALLFYTNAMSVWDQNDSTMPNGIGLLGHQSTKQGCMIAPVIGDSSRYYVFSLDGLWTSTGAGLHYSVVDMDSIGNGTLGNPLGDVVPSLKNIHLADSLSEALTLVRHSNNVDYWVVVKNFYAPQIHSFLVTSAGISATPVTSSLSQHINGSVSTLSPTIDGRNLILTSLAFTGITQLLNFNNCLGTVTGDQVITTSQGQYISSTVSPNDSVIYVSDGGSFWVYDRFAADISGSEQVYTMAGNAFSMQLAPDGKIYGTSTVLQPEDTFLTVINDPNNINNPDIVEDGLSLEGNMPSLSLPNVYISIFDFPVLPVKGKINTQDTVCLGDTLFTNGESDFDWVISTWAWNFDDIASGVNNLDSNQNSSHVFSDSGTYSIQLIVSDYCDKKDTVTKSIYVSFKPDLYIGNDTIICLGDTIQSISNVSGGNHNWSNGSNDTSIQIDATGLYILEVSINKCILTDSINVQITPSVLSLDDTCIIAGQSVLIEVSTADSNNVYSWHPNTFLNDSSLKEPTTTPDSSITYVLTAIDTLVGCTSTTSTQVNVFRYNIVNDTNVCSGTNFNLPLTSTQNYSYDWIPSDGLSDSKGMSPEIQGIKDNIKYYVTIADTASGCSVEDSVNLNVQETPIVDLGNDTSICEGLSLIVSTGNDGSTDYVWSTADTTSAIIISSEGIYNVIAKKGDCIAKDSITVTVDDCSFAINAPSIFTPNGDNLNDMFYFYYIGVDESKPISMIVRNRWGNIVYQTNDIKNPWNGMHNGTPANIGLYNYELTAFSIHGNQHTAKGSFVLTR